jgi:hypothetical protein
LGRLFDRIGAKPQVLGRQSYVSAITYDVYEVGFWKKTLYKIHLVHVKGRFVTPPRLPEPLCVQLVKSTQRFAEIKGLDGGDPLPQQIFFDTKISPSAVGHHGFEKGLLGVRSVFARLRRTVDEVGLRWDRQIRMGVEHEPEQCRPRTLGSNDEGDRGQGSCFGALLPLRRPACLPFLLFGHPLPGQRPMSPRTKATQQPSLARHGYTVTQARRYARTKPFATIERLASISLFFLLLTVFDQHVPSVHLA